MAPPLILLTLALLTFIPALELRASIPVSFFTPAFRAEWSLALMIGICLLANIAVGVVAFWLMGPVERLLRRWGWFDRHVWPRIARGQEKLQPYVAKYGEWGLALFIGVPLPGTGAYTGAFGAYLLGFDRRRFWWANIFGVLIACLAVVVLCLLIEHGVVAEDSLLRRVFMNEDSLLRRIFLKLFAAPGAE